MVAADGPAPVGDVACVVIGGAIIIGGVCIAFCDDAINAIGELFGNLFSDGDDETEVTFGHGSRHLEGTGLSQEEVEAAIEGQIQEVADDIPAGKVIKGTVVVGGKTVEYHAYKVSEGRINVGTYIPR